MKIKGTDFDKVKLFQKDKEKFYVLSLIATAESPLLLSDLNSYIIGRSEVGLPTWIWTKDKLDPDTLLQVEEELKTYLVEGENKFTCKKELFELLKKEYDTTNILEMGYLSCTKPIKPLKGKGIFVRPNYGDKVTLAEYWRDNNKELFNKSISQSDALEEVSNWIEDKRFYVLKDSTGEIVSMAGYGIVGNLAKITHVFTPKEKRGQGYCQYLIYSLSKMLIDEGLKPVLYTDYSYKASNEAYKKVGFVDEGTLINFSIEQEKKKIK